MEPRLCVRIRAVVWECGEGQADRQTHIHTRLTRNVITVREIYQNTVAVEPTLHVTTVLLLLLINKYK